jgi:transcription elongation factor SPT6
LIHFSAWDEIHGVFGDGHEYDWALEGDEESPYDEEQPKPEMKYQDVMCLLHYYYFFVSLLLGL